MESSFTIDLRSDTVTKPTKEMRQAMATAEVGDDVFGEDPTVNKLQQIAAEMFGKEAGLFVPSGTMGNLISNLVHCWGRGSQVYVGDHSHVNSWEQGGISQFGGISPRVLPLNPDGTFDVDQLIKGHRTGENVHHSKPELVVVENPIDGKVLPLDYMKKVHDAARLLGLKIHLDGARIGNAILVLQCKPTDIARWADSVSICLSKGLGAPVGTVIVGSKDFISRARRVRKGLGGGMRQAGILAAAGIIALTKMMERLADDHKNAKEFAEGIKSYASDLIQFDMDAVQTNMIWFQLLDHVQCDEQEFARMMADMTEENRTSVRILGIAKRTLRATFHNGVTNADTKMAIEKLKAVCEKIRQASALQMN